MNAKTEVGQTACAPSNAPKKTKPAYDWNRIDWKKVSADVKKLQTRIAKAQKEGRYGKARALQWMLTHSFSAKALAVKQATENPEGRIPVHDPAQWTDSKSKTEAISSLRRRGYRPSPLLRACFQKSDGNFRKFRIPTMKDRAMQALYGFAMEPVAEVMRNTDASAARNPQDAAIRCAKLFAQHGGATWVLKGSVQIRPNAAFHAWMENHIPMDKQMLRKFLKYDHTGAGRIFPTSMVLDGLEPFLQHCFRRRRKNSGAVLGDVRVIRCEKDFLIASNSREFLETQAKPLAEAFVAERGATLSPDKTAIFNLQDGFDFLGFHLRRYPTGKFFLQPSKDSRKAFLGRIREIVRHSKASTQQELIARLNPIIRQWAAYYAGNASQRAFSTADHQILQCLWRWAKRRHPNKGGRWIYDRYFHTVNGRAWCFAAPLRSPESTDEWDYFLLERTVRCARKHRHRNLPPVFQHPRDHSFQPAPHKTRRFPEA